MSSSVGAHVPLDGNMTPTKRSRSDFNTFPSHSTASDHENSNSNQFAQAMDISHTAQRTPSIASPAPIRTCLLIIDVQNDFCTGSLKAPDALSIIPIINSLRVKYDWDLVVFSADAHPTEHCSFHINHAKDPNAKLYEPYRLADGQMQIMWPVHCVKGTWGAQLHHDLIRDPTTDVIVEKGVDVNQEFYSAFIATDGIHHTELHSILRANSITHVAVCGLVYEYCVGNSALDAAKLGYHTTLIEDATRGLTTPAMQNMATKLCQAHVNIARSPLLAQLQFKPKPNSHVPRLVLSPTLAASIPSHIPLSPSARQHPQLQQQFSSPTNARTYIVPVNRTSSLNSEYNLASTQKNTPVPTPAISTINSPHGSPTHSRSASLYSANATSLPTHSYSTTSAVSSSPTSASSSASSPTSSPTTVRPRLLLGLSGSVATIKALELMQLLTQWCEVRVICTGRSKHFFSAAELTRQFQVKVYEDEDEWKPWKRGDEVLHVELRRWADFMLVAPLSANSLAKIANGLCDNLLTTVIRCWSYSTHPLVLAPAMNTLMWDSPFTRKHIATLEEMSVNIIQPIEKTLACGDVGKGAMAAVSDIDQALRAVWSRKLGEAYQPAPATVQ